MNGIERSTNSAENDERAESRNRVIFLLSHSPKCLSYYRAKEYHMLSERP